MKQQNKIKESKSEVGNEIKQASVSFQTIKRFERYVEHIHFQRAHQRKEGWKRAITKKQLRKKFGGVEDIQRIEQVFDGLHHLDICWRLRVLEVGRLHET